MAKGRVTIREEFCKSCGLCVAACPVKIQKISERINAKGYRPVGQTEPEKCIGCAMCGRVCPDLVLSVYKID